MTSPSLRPLGSKSQPPLPPPMGMPVSAGAEGRVELDTEATVDVRLAGVVLLRHAEDNLPLGFADALDGVQLDLLRMPGEHRRERLDDLADRLVKLLLTRVATQHVVVDSLDGRANVGHDERAPSGRQPSSLSPTTAIMVLPTSALAG